MKKITFIQPSKFLGRNGYFNCAGVEIRRENWDQDLIWIEPTTMKGITGRSRIEIPTANIPELIEILQELIKVD